MKGRKKLAIMEAGVIVTMAIEQPVDRGENIQPVIEKVRQGDVDAFEQIVELYQRRLFTIIFRMIGKMEDTRDLLQEVFMKIFRNINKLQAVREPYPYFYRIAINVCMDWLRKNRKKQFSFADQTYYSQDESKGAITNPELLIRQKEKGAIVMESLDCLTHRERAALSLRDLEELKTKEVAWILGCTEATVRSHVASARLKIRNYLLKRYPELERNRL